MIKTVTGQRVLMLLENNGYPQDPRVRHEAQALVEAGYQISIICPVRSSSPLREKIDDVSVYRFPSPPEAAGMLGYLVEYGYSMLAAFFLSVVVYFSEGFDIVHAHNPPDTFVMIALFYKLFNKKFVFDHHDLSPEMYFARFDGKGNQWVYRTLRFFEWLSCRVADRVITTNQSYKQLEMLRCGVPETKITIVRNGPNLQRLQPVPAAIELQRAGKTTLCYVGEMGFHDGVDYLLRTLHKLVYDFGRTDLYCILVGDGDAWLSLRNLASELKLDHYLHFVGRVQADKVAYYLSAADICVAPEPSNDYNDRSTMIKIAEYMAMGKAIAAFDLPEHRVTAGDAALYATANNESSFAQNLMQLMDNPSMRAQMGKTGRERVETMLAWPYQARNLVKLYDELSPQALHAQPIEPLQKH